MFSLSLKGGKRPFDQLSEQEILALAMCTSEYIANQRKAGSI